VRAVIIIDVMGEESTITRTKTFSMGEQAPTEPAPAPGCAIDRADVTVTASSHDGNIPQNMLDGRLDTRWSAEGQSEHATFDLGSMVDLAGVGIAFYSGDSRNWIFEIHASSNGVDFREIY